MKTIRTIQDIEQLLKKEELIDCDMSICFEYNNLWVLQLPIDLAQILEEIYAKEDNVNRKV